MSNRLTAVMFDVDLASRLRLREALPGWRFEMMDGKTADTIARDWRPGAADLLVVGNLGDGAAALKLCRTLAFCRVHSEEARQEPPQLADVDDKYERSPVREDAPILFLVSSEQADLGSFALECGAHRCLMRPLRIKNVTDMLAHLRSRNERTNRETFRNSQAPFFSD